jgi:RNA polymerase sigma-70 factor, ECF subfamily
VSTSRPKSEARDDVPGTLGNLLYADKTKTRVGEPEWIALVHAIGQGDQHALHALFDRAHRLAFTLIMRITNDRQTAEELTLDVFHDVWRHAAQYDADGGTVLGWILNQARSRAIDRVRFEQRKKRVNPQTEEPLASAAPATAEDRLQQQERALGLRRALSALTPDERQAVETAYFLELSYVEAAAQLGQSVGTTKTRIRSALDKLRRQLAGDRDEET